MFFSAGSCKRNGDIFLVLSPHDMLFKYLSGCHSYEMRLPHSTGYDFFINLSKKGEYTYRTQCLG